METLNNLAAHGFVSGEALLSAVLTLITVRKRFRANGIVAPNSWYATMASLSNLDHSLLEYVAAKQELDEIDRAWDQYYNEQ